MSLLKYLKYLNPANILLLKEIIDAIETLVRLIEKLFNCDNSHDSDTTVH